MIIGATPEGTHLLNLRVRTLPCGIGDTLQNMYPNNEVIINNLSYP